MARGYFNPLPSREGRPLRSNESRTPHPYFNPLPSCEGRRRQGNLQPDCRISIHSPHTRGDAQRYAEDFPDNISIHSPHTRGDPENKHLSRLFGISIHSPHTREDSISLQKSIRIYVSLHNKTMIHRFSGLYKPLFCGAEPDIRGAKPTGKP